MSNFQGGNLNIITLIKEIYGALRNLEAKYYELNDNLNKKMSKLETEFSSISSNIELVKTEMKNLNDKFESVKSIDTNIGLDLESQMRRLNNEISAGNSDNKIKLDISELTIDNLIDNNYTIDEINSVAAIDVMNTGVMNTGVMNPGVMDGMHSSRSANFAVAPQNTPTTLDNLLF